MAVGEVVDQCRSHGDLCHNVKGEGRRKSGQSEEPGRGAPEGHSPGRGPGKGVLTHWEEGYGCNLEKQTVLVAGKGTLRNKWQTIINITSVIDS